MAKLAREIAAIIDCNFAGEVEIFVAATESFLAGLGPSIDEFRDAVRIGDSTKIRLAAHRLSGDTSLFHRAKTTQRFRAIEELAKSALPVASALSDGAVRDLEILKCDLMMALKELSHD